MAYQTSRFKSLKIIATATKVLAILLLLTGLVLPYDLSHLHTNLEQENDCLYCQIEQSPGSDAEPIALPGPVALSAEDKFEQTNDDTGSSDDSGDDGGFGGFDFDDEPEEELFVEDEPSSSSSKS